MVFAHFAQTQFLFCIMVTIFIQDVIAPTVGRDVKVDVVAGQHNTLYRRVITMNGEEYKYYEIVKNSAGRYLTADNASTIFLDTELIRQKTRNLGAGVTVKESPSTIPVYSERIQ